MAGKDEEAGSCKASEGGQAASIHINRHCAWSASMVFGILATLNTNLLNLFKTAQQDLQLHTYHCLAPLPHTSTTHANSERTLRPSRSRCTGAGAMEGGAPASWPAASWRLSSPARLAPVAPLRVA